MFEYLIYGVVAYVIYFIIFKGKNHIPTFGEDKIKLEFIPKTQHYMNVRSAVSVEEWKQIAKIHYKEAKGHCEICHKQARLECHEIWDFDTTEFSQRLMGMVALCHECHGGIHYGHTIYSKDRADAVTITKHILKVNNWDSETLKRKMVEAEEESVKLNRLALQNTGGYRLDLTFLNKQKYRNVQLRKMTTDERSRCTKKEMY